MKRLRQVRGAAWALAMGLFSLSGVARAQAHPSAVRLGVRTYPVVMLSDLHFDPIYDAAKVARLEKASLEEWPSILMEPVSADQATVFAKMQKTCRAKESIDAPYALLTSALNEAKTQAGGAKFVTVSGDLLVHDLDCRYRVAMGLPKADEKDTGEYVSARFAEKTANFVMKQVESTYAGMPVYLGLGNNDTECDHNRQSVHDPFFAATGASVIDGLMGVSAAEKAIALDTYKAGGYYAVTMAAPMEKTRLVVVDDVFLMERFATCKGDDKDTRGADAELAWLGKELDGARQRHERVWVLGHLPPIIGAKTTMPKKKEEGCVVAPDPYLASDALTAVMTSHADVVKLGLFGHTHMDSMYLIGEGAGRIPIKIIGSVSAVDGNMPSVTVSKVDPVDARLVDYTVYEASSVTVGAPWTMEYGFDGTYHEQDFSIASLTDLFGRFRADVDGTSDESKAYRTHYFKGTEAFAMGAHWQAYVCSLDHADVGGFKACVCGK